MTAAGHPDGRPVIALLRDVSPRLADCVLTHLPRTSIDPGLAAVQHRAYADALATLGATVEWLPPLPEAPDGVFVEDTALVLDEVAVIAQPGVESRRTETASVAAALAAYRPLLGLGPSATLEGGDVVVAGRTVYVGRSGRTNRAGIDELRCLLAPFDYEVIGVELTGCLHLKSACTFVPPAFLVVNPRWVAPMAFSGLTAIAVDPDEPSAANTITIGDVTLVGAAYPRTARRLREHGIVTGDVDLSELAKAEGALTCSSVIVRATPSSRIASSSSAW